MAEHFACSMPQEGSDLGSRDQLSFPGDIVAVQCRGDICRCAKGTGVPDDVKACLCGAQPVQVRPVAVC